MGILMEMLTQRNLPLSVIYEDKIESIEVMASMLGYTIETNGFHDAAYFFLWREDMYVTQIQLSVGELGVKVYAFNLLKARMIDELYPNCLMAKIPLGTGLEIVEKLL